jgi:hypothetical protein
MEQALEALRFPALDILQPGLLLGIRRELRPLELGAMLVMPAVNLVLNGNRQQFRAISARKVAQAAVGAARSGRRGVYRYTYPALMALAASKPVRIPPPVNPKAQSGAR